MVKYDSPIDKRDLIFLSLVLSGAVKLEEVPVENGDRDVGIIYVPGREAIARNIILLDDLRREVYRQLDQIDRGEDPLDRIASEQ